MQLSVIFNPDKAVEKPRVFWILRLKITRSLLSRKNSVPKMVGANGKPIITAKSMLSDGKLRRTDKERQVETRPIK